MTIADKLPTISDKEIDTLRDNALRLQSSGDAKQRAAADALLPLIEAERAERQARKPPPAARARKTAAPKTLKKAAKKAKTVEPDESDDQDGDAE